MMRKYSYAEVRRCVNKDGSVMFEVASGRFGSDKLHHAEYSDFNENGELQYSAEVTDGSGELGMPLVVQGYTCNTIFVKGRTR